MNVHREYLGQEPLVHATARCVQIVPLALLTVLLVLLGCAKEKSERTPVARLDNRTLTLEEVRAQFDSSRGISEAQLHEYIRRWINNEMLYREAVRLGLDQKPEIALHVEEIRRQLIINALLNQLVYTEKTAESSPAEVEAYYDRHKLEFPLPTDVSWVSFVLFDDRDAANGFRTKVLRGTTWDEALRQIAEDAEQAKHVLARVDSSYFTQANLFPAELWRVAAASSRTEPSFPIRTDNGFYILIVWKFLRQGQPAALAYVRDEIRSRLTIARRKEKLDSLLENLRAKHTVEIMVNAENPDTAAIKLEK